MASFQDDGTVTELNSGDALRYFVFAKNDPVVCFKIVSFMV